MAKVEDTSPSQQETQPIDSLPSSSSSDSGEDKDRYLFGNGGDDTLPFADDSWIDDEYMDTQIMDIERDADHEFLLCHETQALDLGFGTQDLGLEASDGFATQVLDDFDVEVVGDSDDDGTDLLEKNRELGNLLSSGDSRDHANEKINSTSAVVAPLNEQEVSGKVARFASARTAAFRASAVAARATLPNCHSSGQGATNNSSGGEVGNRQCLPSTPVESKNDLRKGKRTARKLFADDSTEEDCFNDLNCIESQEPGEASQANALNFVDKFISEFGLDGEFDCGRITDGKSKPVPNVKGPQELAKKVSYKSGAVKNGIYEWDDNREDEGGGDLFRRRKEELFGIVRKVREPSTEHKEQKRELGVAVDKRKVRSDSRLLLPHRVTRSQKKIQAAKKNLGKVLNAVSEDSNDKIVDTRKVMVLANDTQVAAAEAIDTPRSEDRSKYDSERSFLTGKNLSPGEERGFSNRVITRQSKGTKRIQAMKKASPSPAKAGSKNTERSSKSVVAEFNEVSKESNTRMFDRHEEVEAGADTQMAAEAINALHSGDGREFNTESNCLIGKKPSPEKDISSRRVVTRRSKRIKGIEAADTDLESLKRKAKKATSIRSKDSEKNPDKVVVSSTEKRGEQSNERCMSKLLKRSNENEAEVSNHLKRRRSTRISQVQGNEAGRNSDPAFDTPVKSNTPSKNVSPICMGDEYHRLSCKGSRRSNRVRELSSLTFPLVEPLPETKSTRKRKDLSSIRILFSQHLDEDVTKHQRKILKKFDISEASSMKEATHFIADNFMRTRNMLEAIASGKPVVTTQWLESIDQVKIYVDEDLYILRDSKKEKEFGFNMAVSLAHARQFPLLQGRRVFSTPNTKPGLNTIMTLVKAVHGQPVERLGRSAISEEKVSENLLVLSCEEDRDISIPFLERGTEVYSSELLLNGIVTQKLEYERYRLFTDHVRRTRSTIWIGDRKGGFQRCRG